MTRFTASPLTGERFEDLETLFGRNGACGGCWCMTPRLSKPDFARGKGEPNRRALLALAKGKEPPGILLYRGEAPVGWCSLGPRSAFPWLARSRLLAPVDDREAWSIVCLYVAKDARRQGVAARLLEAAAKHARTRGATVLEGYPTEPAKDLPGVFLWTGTLPSFLAAGFREVARRSPRRPIVRREL